MQNADFDGDDNESPIAHYPYQDKSGRRAHIVLTRSRLVFRSHQKSEAFPLTGLQSIGVETVKNVGIIVALSIGIVLTLCCAVIFGNTIFLQTANAPVFMKTVPVGMLATCLFLLYLLMRLRYWFVGIVVTTDTDTRRYEVTTLNQALRNFVATVEQAAKESKKK